MERLLAGLALAAALQSSQTAMHTGKIAGMVIEEGTKSPVPGAHVFVIPTDETSLLISFPEALTDADGRFTLEAVPPGRYHIGVHKEGFTPPMDPSILPAVDLAADQELRNVLVALQRGGVIAGTVLDPSGQPMVGMAVTALLKRLDTTGLPTPPPDSTPNGTPMLMPFGQDETNKRGEFRIEGLPSGEYVVASSPSPQREAQRTSTGVTVGTTYYPGTTDESAAEAVSVQAGRTVGDITLPVAIARTFRVSGVVVDEDDSPVADTTVMLLPDIRGGASFASLATGAYGSAQSDANGAFTVDGIPPGDYRMMAGGAAMGGTFASSSNIVLNGSGTPLALADKDRPMPEPSLGTIAVTVKDADVADVRLVVKKQQ
jgi:protocatechuate 3,4-dioxygenase beta subunit